MTHTFADGEPWMRLASATFASESVGAAAVPVGEACAGAAIPDVSAAGRPFALEQATDTIVTAATSDSPASPLTRVVRMP
jgi:hypothetical protein